MRTVISHFYNEAYLMPWWLKHHLPLFDYGILIDHGSTDESVDIIRTMAPHWRLVRSTLLTFDSLLTDFEVMTYERDVPGWKIVLNTTEFLMPACDLAAVEAQTLGEGRKGLACSGVICVDEDPSTAPDPARSLLLQKHWGIDDNLILETEDRLAIGLTFEPERNRFYHCSPIGAYQPGRHHSYHVDSAHRYLDLMVFYYNYAPWNDRVIARKLQIRARCSRDDLKRGWSAKHTKDIASLEKDYDRIRPHAVDLYSHRYCADALYRLAEREKLQLSLSARQS
ncbi:glycosyltransferase family 2 protein [Trinickia acidisoli]|uniref:glycosyltransferase family 2 protein n=1 Tax=Trinickia acidisoli TaxID=2767482 RepID=UPI001A8C42DB|nr:glycosyltransferase family 2 protein [Trinickia acidisoli]